MSFYAIFTLCFILDAIDKCEHDVLGAMAAIVWLWGDKHEYENKHMENEELEQWKEPVSFIILLRCQSNPAVASLQNSCYVNKNWISSGSRHSNLVLCSGS